MDCMRNKFTPGAILNDRYETVSPLNHGSFGMVFMAKDRTTGNDVALKCLMKPNAGLEADSTIKIDDQSEEFKLHSRMGRHDNVVNLLDSFETENHSYLVLEYCSMGDLYEAIRQGKGPKETEHVRAFMLQLVDSVAFLHQHGIFHRDIKPENIFLTDSGSMKIGDFGLATADTWSYDIAVGSDRYMAPEQFDPQGNGLSPAKADIWSVGVCLLNVLFSRNPFSEPSPSDPLFEDYTRDRQSLFDVFPNMSQDTFEVLCHSMAIDPERRSLSAVRDAIVRAVSFTTDDEALDDFCTENRDIVTATADRKPLRTPSVASPAPEANGAFPWAQALHMSTPTKAVETSPVRDSISFTEELFPISEGSAPDSQDWTSRADTQSIESYVDSGLGLSLGSTNTAASHISMSRSKPMPIAGSMPALSRAGHALSSIFGRKKQFESKSWSDMLEDDLEEQAEFEREQAPKKSVPSTLSQADTESDGRSTPRAILSELRNTAINKAVSMRSPSKASVKSKADSVSQQTGFVFEGHDSVQNSESSVNAKYAPPSKRSLIDKWAALGDRRRGGAAPTPTRPATAIATASGTIIPQPAQAQKQEQLNWRQSFKPNTWRRNMGFGRQAGITRQWNIESRNAVSKPTADGQKDHDIWQKKEWNLSTDWRLGRTDQDLSKSSTQARFDASHLESTFSRQLHAKRSESALYHAQKLRGKRSGLFETTAILDESDEGDGSPEVGAEWVGGFSDLH